MFMKYGYLKIHRVYIRVMLILMGREEVRGLKFSKMEISIKANGTKINLMARELFGTKMATSILVNG